MLGSGVRKIGCLRDNLSYLGAVSAIDWAGLESVGGEGRRQVSELVVLSDVSQSRLPIGRPKPTSGPQGRIGTPRTGEAAVEWRHRQSAQAIYGVSIRVGVVRESRHVCSVRRQLLQFILPCFNQRIGTNKQKKVFQSTKPKLLFCCVLIGRNKFWKTYRIQVSFEWPIRTQQNNNLALFVLPINGSFSQSVSGKCLVSEIEFNWPINNSN